ncbi:hypothetical protein RND81_04G091300 [Saponaria officinalis]|uniref:glutathione gamma-glutamylcysteinyltransferase n=1 Tax=Saponaria officinalis TaxID=3572 RepID=A0AAW1LDS7_SAPOF
MGQFFAEALANGNMEGFFKLIFYYQTQSEPTFCGLATLAIGFNALSIDLERTWKGPWRWFDDTMLDCCEPLEKAKVDGISFGKVACLAHCNGAKVDIYDTNESTKFLFRKYVKYTGSGHFSPVGGYHAGKDMVLILDVARFKYPPHWGCYEHSARFTKNICLILNHFSSLLINRIFFLEFMHITKHERAPSVLYTMSCRQVDCKIATEYLSERIRHLLSSEDIKSIEDVAEVRKSDSEEENRRLVLKEEVVKQVQETELYIHVILWLLTKPSCTCDEPYASDTSLHEIASDVCCQGAQLLCGNVISRDAISSRASQRRPSKPDNLASITLASGRVIVEDVEHGIEMLAPCCQRKSSCLSKDISKSCDGKPSVNVVLTVLILALPPTTWSYLRHPMLCQEFCGIVSTNNLPDLLRLEVLHLRQQLHFLTVDLHPHCLPP